MEPRVGNGMEWIKFLNNDGQEVSRRIAHEPVEEFRLKALAFAHWTFHRFNGKAVICDLQGNKTSSYNVLLDDKSKAIILSLLIILSPATSFLGGVFG